MKKRFPTAFLSAFAAVVAACLLTFFLTNDYVGKKYQKIVDAMEHSETEFSSLAEAEELVKKYFLGTVDHDVTQEALVRAYVSSLGDRYSRYLNAAEFAAYETSSNGAGYGIGVRVAWDESDGALLIHNVFSGSPAEEAGLRRGDRITRVAGKSVAEAGAEASVSAITGAEGSEVDIHVTRVVGGQTLDFDFSVPRRSVVIESASGEMLDPDIGYVQIFSFNSNTPDQFRGAVEALKEKGAKALIFDLRGNGGGDLDACTQMLDYLLPEGELFRVYDRDGNYRAYESDPSFVDLPMAVLINGESASASEIFAFSVRWFQKGVLVGETTLGKGTAQIVLKMQDGGAVILSHLRFTPPDGVSTEGTGVKPDLAVPYEGEDLYLLPREKDVQLNRALAVLRGSSGSEVVTVEEPATGEPPSTSAAS